MAHGKYLKREVRMWAGVEGVGVGGGVDGGWGRDMAARIGRGLLEGGRGLHVYQVALPSQPHLPPFTPTQPHHPTPPHPTPPHPTPPHPTPPHPTPQILNLARFVSVAKFRPLSWRLDHPYVVTDRMEDVTPRDTVRTDPKCDRCAFWGGGATGGGGGRQRRAFGWALAGVYRSP
jgi:hypothetical protein